MFKQVPSGSTKSQKKTSQLVIRMPFIKDSCFCIFTFSCDRELFKTESVCFRIALINDDIDKLNNDFRQRIINKYNINDLRFPIYLFHQKFLFFSITHFLHFQLYKWNRAIGLIESKRVD